MSKKLHARKFLAIVLIFFAAGCVSEDDYVEDSESSDISNVPCYDGFGTPIYPPAVVGHCYCEGAEWKDLYTDEICREQKDDQEDPVSDHEDPECDGDVDDLCPSEI